MACGSAVKKEETAGSAFSMYVVEKTTANPTPFSDFDPLV